jgi:acetyltransferase-like isoleucine patch superfamily enzyme
MADHGDNIKIHSKPIGKSIFLLIVTFIIFSLGFFPSIFFGLILLYYFAFNQLWQFLLLPFIAYFFLILFIVSQLMISGVIVRIFKIRYEPGEYQYSLKDKNSFRWMIICTIYTPGRKILEIFIIGRIKNIYYRLMGMKIGKNTLVGGAIKDPCVTEFGDNTTMGEYAVVYGHMHNYEKGTLTISPVKVGNNCIIGAGAIIMPGSIIEDNVVVAAGALVTKNQVLRKGKMYGGIPAKEIVKTNKDK